MTQSLIQPYDFSRLPDIFNVTINNRRVWDQRIADQFVVLQILAKRFGAQGDITRNAFCFYPGLLYFGTPLTPDPTYTQIMKPTWYRIKSELPKRGWDEVYAPFDQTDPHSRTPDNLGSYDLSELDHTKALTGELGLFDLSRPSNGVGRECQLALIVGEPAIGFSNARVSRMDKGSPGIAVLRYGDDTTELVDLLLEILGRKGYQTEPFSVDTRHEHKVQTVIKGNTCIICKYVKYLHQP